MPKNDQYFTAGELAALYGIPKQTLLYYDKTGLLAPACVNENGYRFYSVSQYLVLEIILNLRKLNISVQDIKAYLAQPDTARFEALLEAKRKECDAQIRALEETKASLSLSLDAIAKLKRTRLGRIELSFQEEQFLLCSEPLDTALSGKERMQLFSRHNQSVFSKKHFKEFTTGWILDRERFFSGIFNETKCYFTPVSRPAHKKYSAVRPAGLYLRLAFQGTYYRHIPEVFAKIDCFLRRNALEARGDVYVFPLKNHWLTNDTSTYINEISFLVEE